MFNKANFCHIASNNRNDQKGSVFIYKTSDTLAQVTQSAYFNEKLIDINLHDLIIHVQYDPVERTLKKSVLIVTERTMDNVETAPILDQTIGDDIDQLGDQVQGIEEKIPGAASALNQLADKAFVNDIKTAIETTIAGINTSISTLNNDLSQTNQNLAQTNQNLAQTNQNLSQTNQNLSQTNQDLAQASGLITELSNSKADSDLGNIPANYDYVVESQIPTAENGYTWYRKYKSGWVEQGGRTTTVAGQITPYTLPVVMANTEYTITATAHLMHTANAASINFSAIDTTSFSAWANIFGTTGYHAVPFSWFVSGMSAQ